MTNTSVNDQAGGAPDVTETQTDTQTQQDQGSADQSKSFTQADVDRIVGQRLAREREQYADYDQLKESAAELAKIRDGEKTELQRFQDELAAEREARVSAESAAASMKRTQYGLSKGLPMELAEMLTAADDEGLDAQIEKLLPHIKPAVTEPPKFSNSGGFRSGASGSGADGSDPRERAANAVRQLFDR